MASIFDKIRTITLSNIHILLDKGIDNSPGALRQALRDLEDALYKTAEDVEIARGQGSTLTYNIGKLEAEKKRLESDIDALLTDGILENDGDAMPLAEESLQIENNIALQQEQLVENQALIAELENARLQVTRLHSECLHKLNAFESRDRASDARNQMAKAIKGLAGVRGTMKSVDDVASRVLEKESISKARFQTALAGIGGAGPEADVRASKAAAFIAARRKELGENK